MNLPDESQDRFQLCARYKKLRHRRLILVEIHLKPDDDLILLFFFMEFVSYLHRNFD